MTGRRLDRLERKFEHEFRFDGPDRPKFLERVIAHKAVHLSDLGIGQAGICLCKGNELVTVPDAECVVGEKIRAFARAFLRVDQDTIDGERVDLPLPPIAAVAADAIRRAAMLEHEAFDAERAAPFSMFSELLPTRCLHRFGWANYLLCVFAEAVEHLFKKLAPRLEFE